MRLLLSVTLRLALACLLLWGSSGHAQTWTGGVSSDWSDSGNWSGGIPGTSSAVTIPGNTTYSPEITGTVTIKDLTIGDWNNSTTLTVNGGTLTVTENVTLRDHAELKMASGSIVLSRQKNNATFTFGYTNTLITLISGTFTSDLDINVNGGLSTGTANLIMNGGLVVPSGKTGISGDGGTWSINGSLTVNGILDLEGADLQVAGSFIVGSGGIAYTGTGNHDFLGTFEVGNNGTYHGEDAYSIIHNSISAKNSAWITVNNGTLEFRADVDLFSTATIEVTGTGTVKIIGTGAFKQNGNLLIGNGNLEISGDVSFTQGGTLDISDGTVDISGNAVFTQSGTMNIGSGTVTIEGDADFNQSGTVNADDATINISGNLTLGSNGSVFNAGSSTINLDGGTFTNSGTFNPDSSTVNFNGDADQAIVGDITFYNLNVSTDGELQSTGSVVVLNDASIDSTATVVVQSGETIDVQGELDDPSGSVVSNRPFVRHITATMPDQVLIEFNEPITSATASNSANYLMDHGFSILGATAQGDAHFVVLTLSGNMILNTEYEFAFNNLVGAVNGQTISADHIKRYTYVPLVSPPPSGPTNLQITDRTENSMTLEWSPANADATLIVMRKHQPTASAPVANENYEVNSEWGLGSELLPEEYIAYAGPDSTLTVTGLDPSQRYDFSAFAMNGTLSAGTSYNTNEIARTSGITLFVLNARLLLAGPLLDNGLMRTTLGDSGLLPLDQPYTATEYLHNGTEQVALLPNAPIVDWVLVEIRHINNSSEVQDTATIAASRALFLRNDGLIVDLDGASLPRFDVVEDRPLILIIHHRNHLPVMSGDTLQTDENNLHSIRFDTDASAWHNINTAILSTGGSYALSAGKTRTEQVYVVDSLAYHEVWINRNGANGYFIEDLNLDGRINSADRARIFNAQGRSIKLPEAVLPEEE